VCFPTIGWAGLKERISEHFGRSPTFTIVDVETGEVEVVPNVKEHTKQTMPAAMLKRKGVSVLVCGGIGYRALSNLRNAGIKVYYGVSGTVEEALEQFKVGSLIEKAEEAPCPEGKEYCKPE